MWYCHSSPNIPAPRSRPRSSDKESSFCPNPLCISPRNMQTRCAGAAHLKKGDIHLRGPDAYACAYEQNRYRNGPGPGGKLDRSIASPFASTFAISISRDNQFLPPPLGQIPFDEFSAVRRVRHEKFTRCTDQPTNTTFSTSPVQKRARHPVSEFLYHTPTPPTRPLFLHALGQWIPIRKTR
jgi:hypothetical protein